MISIFHKLTRFALLLFAALTLVVAAAAMAHGARYHVLTDDTITVLASYDTGEPFANCDVLVFPPDEGKSESTIRTDSTGAFHFIPDRPGTWVLQIRDKEGHGMRINLDIDEDLGVSSGEPEESFTKKQRAIMGISVFLGLIGLALILRRKKR